MIENAKIERVFLGPEGHGILTAQITLDFGDNMQGFGGCDISSSPCKWISKLLETVGSDTWDELVGLNVRADRPGGLTGRIESIGHIMEDKWFKLSDFSGRETI